MKFSCIVCRSNKFKVISNKTRDSDQKIVSCKNCMHIQIFPLPTDLEEEIFYDQDKQTKFNYSIVNIAEFEKRAAADTKRRLNLMKNRFKGNISVLDVGCGYGFFVKTLKLNGFTSKGLEISSERRKVAQKVIGENVLKFPIAGPNKRGKKFDVVTLFHVLEHIKKPINLTNDLNTYLKEEGTLIVEVPNAKDHMLRMNKSYRNFFWQKAHISYFTPKTIRRVLEKAGYKNIKITGVQRYSIKNAFNWVLKDKPQLKNPRYSQSGFSLLESIYKNFLTNRLICDTLWVEAKTN